MTAADYLTGKNNEALNVICAEEAGEKIEYTDPFTIYECTCEGFQRDNGVIYDTQDIRNRGGTLCPSCKEPFPIKPFPKFPNYAVGQNPARSLLALLSDEDWRKFRWALMEITGCGGLRLVESFKAFMLATPLQICTAFAVARGRVDCND